MTMTRPHSMERPSPDGKVREHAAVRQACQDQIRKHLREKFDHDGDGRLNDREEIAAREAMHRRSDTARQELPDRIDRDVGGDLSRREMAAAHHAWDAHHDQARRHVRERSDRSNMHRFNNHQEASPRDAMHPPRRTDGPAAYHRLDRTGPVSDRLRPAVRMAPERPRAEQRAGDHPRGRPNASGATKRQASRADSSPRRSRANGRSR